MWVWLCAGVVWLVDALDAEQRTRHEVRLLVRDQATLAPAAVPVFGDGAEGQVASAFRTATATLVLNVLDVNDNPVRIISAYCTVLSEHIHVLF